MIEPLRDNLLVELTICGEEYKITLPDRSASDYHYGIIRVIGPDVKRLRVDDVIMMPTWDDGKLITANGIKYIVLSENSISVRITDE